MIQKSTSCGTTLDEFPVENGNRETVCADTEAHVIARQFGQEGNESENRIKSDDVAFGVQSSSSLTLDQLVAEMKQLGGPDYDFGAEEWDVLPKKLLEKMIKSMDETGPEGQSETVDWGPDRGSEIIEDDYSPKSDKDYGQ